MTSNDFENLYLFEFMVDEVFYSAACKMNFEFLKTLGPTCIEFSSQSFPSVCMSQDEFGVCPPYEHQKVKFGSGKSVMFARSESWGRMPPCNKAQISVSRRLPPGGCSSQYKFGTAYLKLSDEFLSVFNCTGSSKCIRVGLNLINTLDETTGNINFFIRLTSLGSAVYTKFHPKSEDKAGFTFEGDKMVN